MGKIQWTDATWNPVTGCSKVSPGCKNCYADRVWARLSKNPKLKDYFGRKFGDVRCHESRLDQPLRWKRPRRIFVNSMSDLFHEKVPVDFLDRAFAVMALAQEHTFQVLTKRPECARRYLKQKDPCCLSVCAPEEYPCAAAAIEDREWPLPNVWLGVSVEDQATADERIPILLETPAAVRFLSVEPMLEPIDISRWMCSELHDPSLDCRDHEPDGGIDWVIFGGESGPGARSCNIEWIRDGVRQCRGAGVPPFVKQLGSRAIFPYAGDPEVYDQTPYFRRLRHLKGGDPSEWPEDLRDAREFPP